MNLLEDDREQYVIGGLAKTASKKLKELTSQEIKKVKQYFEKLNKKKFPDEESLMDENELNPAFSVDDLAKQIEREYKGSKEFDDIFFVSGSYGEDFALSYDTIDKVIGRKKMAVGGMLENDREQYGLGGLLKKLKQKIQISGLSPDEYKASHKESQAQGGYSNPSLLTDDLQNIRKTYVIGGAVSAIKKGITKLLAKVKESAGKRQDSKRVVELRTTLKEFDDYDTMLQKKMSDDPVNTDYTEEFELLQEAKFYVESELTQFSKMNRAEGGEIQEEEELPMESENSGMLPDDEMEDEFLDYVLDTALTDQEEEMLMSKIEQDEELSMLFDKVIDVAQEFAGSGPVEGPGSGVSDSIPARLSDGEFVFTAAAVEEIGADNLMAMMKDAEMKAEQRQGLAEGGMPEEEETVTMKVQEQKEPKVQIAKATVNSNRGLLDEDEISKGIKSKMMLDPLQRHVRS